MTFTCEHAPALLGLPDHRVETCREVPHLPGFFRVTLSHPDQGYVGVLVPTDAQGRVEAARGPAAATAWLRRTGVLSDPGAGMLHLMMVLQAFEALPPPLTIDSQSFEVEGVGAASLERAPFRLTLYAETSDPTGMPADPTFVRGVLTEGDDGRLAWTLARGPAWEHHATIPAE